MKRKLLACLVLSCVLLTGCAATTVIYQEMPRPDEPQTDPTPDTNSDGAVKTGLSSKDFIAPSSFSFKSGPDLNATKYFKSGDRVGAVSYIKIDANDMEDRIISDILSIDSNIWISIHADTMARDEAINLAKDNYSSIQAMIIDENKNAVANGYDMDILPPELKTYYEAGEKLYKDLRRKDEQLSLVTITVVQTAENRKKLEDNIFELNVGGDYNIEFGWTEIIPEKAFNNSDELNNASICLVNSTKSNSSVILAPNS